MQWQWRTGRFDGVPDGVDGSYDDRNREKSGSNPQLHADPSGDAPSMVLAAPVTKISESQEPTAEARIPRAATQLGSGPVPRAPHPLVVAASDAAPEANAGSANVAVPAFSVAVAPPMSLTARPALSTVQPVARRHRVVTVGAIAFGLAAIAVATVLVVLH